MARKPRETNNAPAIDNVASFPPKVCKALQGMAAARKTSKDRLATLIEKRGELDEELNQLGAGHTEEHLEKRSEMVVAIRAIKWQRARIRRLSDSIDELLLEPNQDRLFDDLPDYTTHDPDEAALFAAGGESDDDGDEDGGRAPVGEAGGPSLEYETAADAAGGLRLAGQEREETIDDYLPGRWKDQNGADVDLGDFAAVQEMALQAAGADACIKPAISKTWGARIEITRGDGSKVATLTYAGPIPEKAKRGRKRAGK